MNEFNNLYVNPDFEEYQAIPLVTQDTEVFLIKVPKTFSISQIKEAKLKEYKELNEFFTVGERGLESKQ